MPAAIARLRTRSTAVTAPKRSCALIGTSIAPARLMKSTALQATAVPTTSTRG